TDPGGCVASHRFARATRASIAAQRLLASRPGRQFWTPRRVQGGLRTLLSSGGRPHPGARRPAVAAAGDEGEARALWLPDPGDRPRWSAERRGGSPGIRAARARERRAAL